MSKGNSGLFTGTKGSVADEWGWLIPDSSPSSAYLALVSGKNKSKSGGSASIGMVLSFKDSDSANSSQVPSSLAWHGVADDQENDDNEPWQQLPNHEDDDEPWQHVPVHDDGDDNGDNNDSEDENDDDGNGDNNDEGGDENNDSDEEQDDYSELESHMHQLVMEWAQTTINKLPKKFKRIINTACIVFDAKSEKYYYGRNGGYLAEGYERNPIIFGDESNKGILPDKKLNEYPVGNCAEVDAANRALNDHAELGNLFMLTIHTTKNKFGEYKESCKNCEYTFKGRIKHNFSGWKDGNINHEH